ncbi:MAG: hypothetical protein H6708_03965 [Kofleriaceae bacterium]|nr:hypothetical protein [Kofleriaceae bacterium]
MRRKTILAGVLVGLLAGGILYAAPGDGTDGADGTGDGTAAAPDGTGGGTADELPDVVVSSDTEVKLSPREMASESDKMIEDMQGMLRRVLELQSTARKSKDVIKLNCVNDKLLAIKKLVNIAESSRNDLTEAISGGDPANQRHQYIKVKQSSERATSERDGAEACIGEELIFVGPTEVTTDGPIMPDDPTDDGDDWFSNTSSDFERTAYASIWH